MRIVGGSLRGRPLATPRHEGLRPTSDRLRETLFNVLAHAHGDPVPGAHVMDLFAGTGALGLEALSRGAAHATFVDTGPEARGLIRANIDALGLGGRTRLYRRDATALGPRGAEPAAGLVFLDPPYGQGLAGPALAGLLAGGWLEPGALVVVEERADVTVAPTGFEAVETRRQGDTALTLLRPA